MRSTSLALVRQFETERRIALRSFRDGAARPGLAALLDGTEDSVGRRVVLESDQHLVQDDVVQDLASRQPGEPVGKRARSAATALDEIRHTGATERAKCRVDREPSRAPRVLGGEVERISRGTSVGVHEVRGSDTEGGLVGSWVSA